MLQIVPTSNKACGFVAKFQKKSFSRERDFKPGENGLLFETTPCHICHCQEISQLPDDTGVCGLNTESAICDLQVAASASQIGPKLFSRILSKANFINGGYFLIFLGSVGFV